MDDFSGVNVFRENSCINPKEFSERLSPWMGCMIVCVLNPVLFLIPFQLGKMRVVLQVSHGAD